MGEAVTYLYSADPRVSPTPERIERVARAICAARGIDPDRYPANYITGPTGCTRDGSRVRKPWERYETQAKEFIVCLAAMVQDLP